MSEQEVPGSKPVKEATVEGLREEFYDAMMSLFLTGGMHEIEGHTFEAGSAHGGKIILLQFAVRTGLISPNEGNEWLDAVHGRQVPAKVMMKYHPSSPLKDEAA